MGHLFLLNISNTPFHPLNCPLCFFLQNCFPKSIPRSHSICERGCIYSPFSICIFPSVLISLNISTNSFSKLLAFSVHILILICHFLYLSVSKFMTLGPTTSFQFSSLHHAYLFICTLGFCNITDVLLQMF